MDRTPNLSLPYITAAQAQKHLTHNQALRDLDGLVQLSVLDRDLAAPPGSVVDGARYVVAPGASGAWSGHVGEIAVGRDGGWAFHVPGEGWLAWVVDEARICVWDGADWSVVEANPPSELQNLHLLGIETSADATNRLSLKSPASLFDHAGAGHRHKINKATAGDTASLLFQTGYQGRGEIGIAGDDDLRIKVSADGTAWHEAVVVDRASGAVSLPNSRFVEPHVFSARVADHLTVYANGAVIQLTPQTDPSDGFSSTTNAWILPADGSYFVALTLVAKSFTDVRTGISVLGGPGVGLITRAISNTTATPTFTAQGIYSGAAGDAIWLTAFNPTAGTTSSYWLETRVSIVRVA